MKLKSSLFYGYILSLIIYSGFTLLPAPNPIVLLRYHVSVLGLRIIDLTIILILAVIWFAGFYGYTKLRAYASLIKGEKDGKHVARLAQGIFLLVIWQPISSVSSTILNYIAMKHLGLVPAIAILNHYISLVFPLIGFILISQGARGLGKLARQQVLTYRSANVLVILLIYLGLTYYRVVVTTTNRASVYHMSIWLILLTLIAPYIYMWFLGFLAAYDIYRYQKKVAGTVYKRSWKFLALGLGWLIMTSILFQFFTALLGHLSHLSIYWLLAIVYSLLIVLSVGFILIAIGTSKLQKIEEV